MRLTGNRDNWTYAPEVSAIVGRWVGYQIDPMQKINGVTHYVAGIVRANGRLAPNTDMGRGGTPEFALSEFLRNNNISVPSDKSEEQVRPQREGVDKLIKAVKSLLVDIGSMRQQNTSIFGEFFDSAPEADGVLIDWPNLAISTDNVVHALEEYEHGQIIDGELAQARLQGKNPSHVVLDAVGIEDNGNGKFSKSDY